MISNMMRMRVSQLLCVFASLAMLMVVPSVLAIQCSNKIPGCGCAPGFCCSNWGFCGTTGDYCDRGKCQCQCPTPPPPFSPPPPVTPPPPVPSPDITEIIGRELFDKMLPNRNDVRCPANGFYTYDAFVQAARSFPRFATTGNIIVRKREVAAFLGQTSQETNGGWPDAPGGPYAWGYCFKLRNQGPCGTAIGEELLSNADLVATNAVISFKCAIEFWMTTQSPKPSCHNVIIGKWRPSQQDIIANRLPGYGVITNIYNGGGECGHGPTQGARNRIGFYKRYCDMLKVSYGRNLDCNNQTPFPSGLLLNSI